MKLWEILLIIGIVLLVASAFFGWYCRSIMLGKKSSGGFVGGSAGSNPLLILLFCILLLPFYLTAYIFARLSLAYARRKRGKKNLDKYNVLWEHLKTDGSAEIELTFTQIKEIADFDVDRAFAIFKKDAKKYGLRVDKILYGKKIVKFSKIT